MLTNPDLPDSTPLGSLQRWPIALLLTVIAGYIDIVGYLSVYHVFTAHMSGNTADMAKHLYPLQWSGIARHAWPILTFLVGLLLGAILFEAQRRKAIHQRVPATLIFEALLILIFLIASGGRASTIPPQPMPKYYFMVALLAVAMGVQNVTLRSVGSLNIYTTFITGSLVKFAEAASQYIFWFFTQWQLGRDRMVHILRASSQIAAVHHMALTAGLWVCYLAGATAGVWALSKVQTRCMLLPLIVLIGISIFAAVHPFSENVLDQE